MKDTERQDIKKTKEQEGATSIELETQNNIKRSVNINQTNKVSVTFHYA